MPTIAHDRTGRVYAVSEPRRATRNRGQVVALAGFGINLTLGVLYAWSVIGKAIGEQWGWSRGAVSLPYAVAVASFAAMLAFGGRAQDKFGPRLICTIGVILLGSGLLLSAAATPDSPFPMIVGFGVLGGSGIALGFVSTFPAAAKWFSPKQRGIVTGLVVSGFGLAPVYIAPATTLLLNRGGINETFVTLGVVFLVVGVALAQLIRNPPVGLTPIPDAASLLADEGRHCPKPQSECTWREMVRTPTFVMLWLMYGLTAFAGLMVIGHMAAITVAQTGRDLGFLLVALLAIGNALGRVLAGAGTDSIGPVRTMTIVFSFQSVVLVVAGFLNSAFGLGLAAFLIGLNYGADLALFPCAVAEFFGQRNQGVNYGVVFTSWGIGGVFGAMTGGAIADATGSYLPAFIIAAVMCALAAVISLLTRPPRLA